MMGRFTDAAVEGNSLSEPKVKFLSYSTHDWTVAQMLLFFSPDYSKFEVLPYASQVILELHSSEDCNSEECFWVEAFYNGCLLSFDGQCEDTSRCTYPEFMHMMQERGFVNTSTHYDAECAEEWTPPSSE